MSDAGATIPGQRPEPSPEPTPEQYAERARRADRATRGALAGVLALEAVVVLLVPRTVAVIDHGVGAGTTIALVVLAVLMIAAAGLLRRPWGIGFGSALQLVFLLAVVVVALIFAAVWTRLLFLRRDVVGTPGGWRMLIS